MILGGDPAQTEAVRVTRVRFAREALAAGYDPADAEAYADAMLRTLAGQSLVLDHHVADLRRDLWESWPGRRLRALADWLARV